MRIHPSAKTNNISLKGMEIIIGESIIMPMDIKPLATIRSIITNGIYIRNPIVKAVFNSDVMNDGISPLSGMLSSSPSYGEVLALKFTYQLDEDYINALGIMLPSLAQKNEDGTQKK